MPFPSSYFNPSITSDSIDPLLSDFTPFDASESQSTAPNIYEPPPPSIERVGPDREKEWALWSEMSKTEFIEWWLTTQYGSKPKGEHPHWDKRGYTSELWQFFNQVAHIKTGQPKAICKACSQIVDHPVTPNKKGTKYGTNALKRHTKAKCRGAGPASEQNIQDLWKKAVSEDLKSKTE